MEAYLCDRSRDCPSEMKRKWIIKYIVESKRGGCQEVGHKEESMKLYQRTWFTFSITQKYKAVMLFYAFTNCPIQNMSEKEQRDMGHRSNWAKKTGNNCDTVPHNKEIVNADNELNTHAHILVNGWWILSMRNFFGEECLKYILKKKFTKGRPKTEKTTAHHLWWRQLSARVTPSLKENDSTANVNWCWTFMMCCYPDWSHLQLRLLHPVHSVVCPHCRLHSCCSLPWWRWDGHA